MRTSVILTAAALSLAWAAPAAAQPLSVERKQVSSHAARLLVDACLDYARANNILVAVAVVDLAGVLMDFHAMEGAQATVSETAILKAKTAAHWRRSTRTLEEDVTSGRNQASVWINDFPKLGALPIMIEGQFAGAIGIGGAAKQEECAQAALDKVFGPSAVAAR